MATPAAQRSIGIALLGCGVVGGGVVKILTEQREMLRCRTNLSFDLRHIVVRNPGKRLAANMPTPFSTDAAAAIDDPAVNVVIELIGGTDLAGQYVERALRLGKPVITANKSLLSQRGAELFAMARKHNTCIGFEASCGGGVPIINALRMGLAGNRIDALVGIVNGTCNVILTRMSRNRWAYDRALAEAQRQGYAEADPMMDVSGRDTAQKLAILSSLAFNVRVREEDIHIEGIDHLQMADIEFAGELGYVVKLLAIAERARGKDRAANDSLFLRVHPTLIHRDDVLADVSEAFNAISVYGHAVGHTLFYGRGAGAMPTASAVVADLIGLGLGSLPLEFSQLRIFPDTTEPANVVPFEELQTRYYLRLMAKDEPGVLAQVTAALGTQGISLSAILQRENSAGQCVPVVITTHLAREGAMQAAIKQIDALPTIQAPSVCLRIIETPREFAEG
jgi:homoserine dehydrogenase